MNALETVQLDLKERSYPIHIGQGLLERAAELLPFDITGRKIFVIYDRAVEGHVRRLLSGLPVAPEMKAFDGGERTKSYDRLEAALEWLLENGVDRKSLLFVVGGGVVGDLGGFAASVVLRGIDFVQVPTTLLAQVDSSVGGKTGINTAQGKNLVGTFYQPKAVLCDLDVLQTLPPRELKAGYAEIVKYGLLDDFDFFEWLERHGEAVLSLDADALTHAIKTSCAMKARIVGDDEREQAGGDRALLNLGHTFAHALEAAALYDGRLLHGEAVSIGMVLAFRLCARAGLCDGQEAKRVEQHLTACGLMTDISQIEPPLRQNVEELWSLMTRDKKSSNGRIGFILVHAIGRAFQSPDIDKEDVLAVLKDSLQ